MAELELRWWMPQWSDHGKSLAIGVSAVGVLASASAVLNIISHIVSSPFSTWLEAILGWYRALFFPIVDNTIGIIPRIFGFHLLSWVKDAIVVYFIFGSAVARTSHTYYRRRGEFKIFPIILAMTTWPVALLIVIYDSILEDDEEEKTWTRRIAKNIAIQLSFVILVVVSAMALNAADILV